MKKWKLKSKARMEQRKKSSNPVVMVVLIALAAIGIFGFFLRLSKDRSDSGSPDQTKSEISVNNVSMKDGKQIVEITAKAGYSPRQSLAKAGVPTVIKFKTAGTYDCSSALRIPSLNISKNLPGSGETEIDIGPQEVGKLAGTCSMGMYSFVIDFQS